jgi:hypothetical protein
MTIHLTIDLPLTKFFQSVKRLSIDTAGKNLSRMISGKNNKDGLQHRSSCKLSLKKYVAIRPLVVRDSVETEWFRTYMIQNIIKGQTITLL